MGFRGLVLSLQFLAGYISVFEACVIYDPENLEVPCTTNAGVLLIHRLRTLKPELQRLASQKERLQALCLAPLRPGQRNNLMQGHTVILEAAPDRTLELIPQRPFQSQSRNPSQEDPKMPALPSARTCTGAKPT